MRSWIIVMLVTGVSTLGFAQSAQIPTQNQAPNSPTCPYGITCSASENMQTNPGSSTPTTPSTNYYTYPPQTNYNNPSMNTNPGISNNPYNVPITPGTEINPMPTPGSRANSYNNNNNTYGTNSNASGTNTAPSAPSYGNMDNGVNASGSQAPLENPGTTVNSSQQGAETGSGVGAGSLSTP